MAQAKRETRSIVSGCCVRERARKLVTTSGSCGAHAGSIQDQSLALRTADAKSLSYSARARARAMHANHALAPGAGLELANGGLCARTRACVCLRRVSCAWLSKLAIAHDKALCRRYVWLATRTRARPTNSKSRSACSQASASRAAMLRLSGGGGSEGNFLYVYSTSAEAVSRADSQAACAAAAAAALSHNLFALSRAPKDSPAGSTRLGDIGNAHACNRRRFSRRSSHLRSVCGVARAWRAAI